MRIGRLYITTNKHTFRNNNWKWQWSWWPRLWIGWYESEDEYLDRILK